MSAYLSVDVMECLRARHRFVVTGSDKTPMKKNLICITCTDRNPGKTVYAAYGDGTKGFGEWRNTLLRHARYADNENDMSTPADE